jgi:hypothetical protein
VNYFRASKARRSSAAAPEDPSLFACRRLTYPLKPLAIQSRSHPEHPATARLLFPELKNQIGLRRLRLRRMRFVREQFYMAAAVQNLKRLVRFLSFNPQPVTAII